MSFQDHLRASRKNIRAEIAAFLQINAYTLLRVQLHQPSRHLLVLDYTDAPSSATSSSVLYRV